MLLVLFVLSKLARRHTRFPATPAAVTCDSVLTCAPASAAGGLTPTMAAAVVKLIGPDMPTSGLHVSLEAVARRMPKRLAIHLVDGLTHGRLASHAAPAGGCAPQLTTLASAGCLQACACTAHAARLHFAVSAVFTARLVQHHAGGHASEGSQGEGAPARLKSGTSRRWTGRAERR